MSRLALAMAIAFFTTACSSTIDVGQAGSDGGTSGTDGGMSSSDTGGPSLTPGTADVTGTVNGDSFVVKDVVGSLNNAGPVANELWVSILDHAGICAVIQQGAESFASTKGLRLDLLSDSPMPVKIGTGTFTIGDTSAAKPTFTAFYLATDATCTAGVGRTNATGGTITITEITATAINGTFDLTFASGSLKGSFGASTCSDMSTGHIKCAP